MILQTHPIHVNLVYKITLRVSKIQALTPPLPRLGQLSILGIEKLDLIYSHYKATLADTSLQANVEEANT